MQKGQIALESVFGANGDIFKPVYHEDRIQMQK